MGPSLVFTTALYDTVPVRTIVATIAVSNTVSPELATNTFMNRPFGASATVIQVPPDATIVSIHSTAPLSSIEPTISSDIWSPLAGKPPTAATPMLLVTSLSSQMMATNTSLPSAGSSSTSGNLSSGQIAGLVIAVVGLVMAASIFITFLTIRRGL